MTFLYGTMIINILNGTKHPFRRCMRHLSPIFRRRVLSLVHAPCYNLVVRRLSGALR